MSPPFADWLNEHTRARIARSDTHGVGVVALRDLPKGTDPFPGVRRRHRLVGMTRAEVDALEPHARRMVLDFCLPDRDGIYHVYGRGFQDMDVSFYMNSCTTPNVETHSDGSTLCAFRTCRDVRAGEELTFRYDPQGEPLDE